jgi:RNA polymerase sigma-70 factor (ECF subfamily)
MNDENLMHALRAADAREVEKAPTQHPLRTPECPPLTRFSSAGGEGWTPQEREHVTGCPYCQRVTALGWRAECPTSFDWALYLEGRSPDQAAMKYHLEHDRCPRCGVLVLGAGCSPAGRKVGGRGRAPAAQAAPAGGGAGTGEVKVDQNLSHISTVWTLVREAHADSTEPDNAHHAQRALLERYGGAVRRYLLGALRHPDAAEELFQEFACRLLRGDLHGADSSRGRFRDFVKGVLFHLIADYHHQRRRRPQPLAVEPASPEQEAAALAEADRAFLENWRAELLARSWGGLAALEQASGQPSYTVLRFRAEHPQMHSPEMAEQLSAILGKAQTAAGVRQALHRARDKFAELLLYEVRQSLENPTKDRLEQELADLGLLEYCKPALER